MTRKNIDKDLFVNNRPAAVHDWSYFVVAARLYSGDCKTLYKACKVLNSNIDPKCCNPEWL